MYGVAVGSYMHNPPYSDAAIHWLLNCAELCASLRFAPCQTYTEDSCFGPQVMSKEIRLFNRSVKPSRGVVATTAILMSGWLSITSLMLLPNLRRHVPFRLTSPPVCKVLSSLSHGLLIGEHGHIPAIHAVSKGQVVAEQQYFWLGP